MYRRKESFLVIFLFLVNLNLSFGQVVKGKLLNEENAPLPGVLLSINSLETKNSTQITTNGIGSFRVFNLIQGKYQIISLDEKIKFDPIDFDLGPEDLEIPTIIAKSIDDLGGDDIAVVSVEDLQQISGDDVQAVSSVLSSSRDPFDEAAAFNLSNGRFRARGYNNEDTETFLNGMNVNDLDDGRVLFNSWGGLNDVTRAQTNVFSLKSSDFAFGGLRGATFIDLRATAQRVQTRFTYSNGNRSFRHRLMATHSTGLQENGWAYSFSVSKRWANSGFIKGTHFDSYGYYAAVDKKVNDKHSLSFMVIGSPLRRGKGNAHVQELYDLAGSNFYNSNWGFQNGEVRNSREDRIHQPVVSLRHDFKISKKSRLMTSVGYQFGKNGTTRLDWYQAADPRPDYYRKLPSYQESPEAKNAVTAFYKGDEANRQLDWDAMYEANRNRIETINDVNGSIGNNVTGKSSAYVLQDQRFDVQKLNLNSILNSNLNASTTLTAGVSLLAERNHNFQLIDDLLGGDFFLDFDDFAERDFKDNPDAQQNDLNRPNRIVREGDIVGYDYNINTSSAGGWAQLAFVKNRNDAFIAIKSDLVSFYREGFMRNGRFPETSFGKSDVNSFFTYAIKAGNTFKINGRNYIYANGEYKTRAPFSRFAYLSPRIRDQIVSDLTTEKIAAGEVGYIFRLTSIRGRLTAYATQFNDQIENTSFFNDDVNTFVNYVVSDISKIHSGIELGLNATINTRISLEGALALGDYRYTNRPLASITQDNSSKTLASGKTLYLKNFYVPGTPQTAATFGVNYNSPKFWWLNFNVNYFDRNYVDVFPDRRTSEAVELINKAEDPTKFYSIISQEKLPSAITVDMFAGKSWRIKRKYTIAANLSVGNLLGKKDFVTSGFEQGRFDYDTKDVNKFPSKYFYGFGRNYSFNINLSF